MRHESDGRPSRSHVSCSNCAQIIGTATTSIIRQLEITNTFNRHSLNVINMIVFCQEQSIDQNVISIQSNGCYNISLIMK